MHAADAPPMLALSHSTASRPSSTVVRREAPFIHSPEEPGKVATTTLTITITITPRPPPIYNRRSISVFATLFTFNQGVIITTYHPA